MRRVMIIGQPGSGKSSFARALGHATGLPVHHMDRIHWLPGWRPRPREEKLRLVRAVEAGEAWILEGGLSATYDERAARADTIVHLHAPVGRRLWRVTHRLVRYWGRERPDMQDGCPETLGAHTLEFYRYIWRTRHSAHARMEALKARATADTRVVTLHGFDEHDAFVAAAGRAPRG